MHFTRRYPRGGAMALLAGGALLLAACGSDPLDPGDDDHGEADPAGVLVEWLDQEVIRYMDGDPVPDVELPPNSSFGDVEVTFLDDQGDALALPAGEEFEVRLIIEDESVLSWEAGAPGAPGGSPHFRVNLETGEEGTTTLALQLWHVDEGHEDWESPPVTVTLQEPNGGG